MKEKKDERGGGDSQSIPRFRLPCFSLSFSLMESANAEGFINTCAGRGSFRWKKKFARERWRPASDSQALKNRGESEDAPQTLGGKKHHKLEKDAGATPAAAPSVPPIALFAGSARRRDLPGRAEALDWAGSTRARRRW